MAESKFLQYQDPSGDGLIDVCDEVVELPPPACDESPCIPNGTATTPNWRLAEPSIPFLNEKICHYQVAIETRYTTTIDESLLEDPDLTDEEAEEALNVRFEENLDAAVTAFLENYNKDDSEASQIIVKDAIMWDVGTDYYLPARALSRMRFLYSLPFEVLYNLETADSEEEDDTAAAPALEVTYTVDELKTKLTYARKALRLYSWYNKIFMKIDGGNLYYEDEPLAGMPFALDSYGAWESGKRSILGAMLPELDEFLNTKGYNIGGVGKFGGFMKDKVSSLAFSFDEGYALSKITIYTQGCPRDPVIFKEKLSTLKTKSAWKDVTALGYLAQLGDMATDLTAREPVPWLEFVKKYTYPAIYSSTNQGYTNTDPKKTVGSCVAEALTEEGKQLGEDILDEVFGLGDAIAYQYHKNLCLDSPDKLIKKWADINIIYDPDAPNPQEAEKTLMAMAKEQAYKELDTEGQDIEALCFGLTTSVDSIDDLYKNFFDRLTACGLTDLMLSAVGCLFGGLSFEDAMGTVLESALRAMSLENFDKLFIGLPPDKQAELDALVKKKLESGDVFQEGSNLQLTSDDMEGKLEMETPFENQELVNEQNDKYLQSDPPNGGALEIPPADATRRTLAQRLDPSTEASAKMSPNVVMEAYILALLEVYSEAYLDLLGELNKLPGAQVIAYAMATLSCPKPPQLNPSRLDFIKDASFPICDGPWSLTAPRLSNPFAWYPEIKDPSRLLFEPAMEEIQQTVLNVLIMILTKLCEVLGNAACTMVGGAGSALAALASGGRTKIADAITESICGEGADQEQIDNTVVDLFSSLGVGATALADTDQVLNFAGDLSTAVTTEELYNAFLCEPSAEFLMIAQQIIQYEYPDFEAALGTQQKIKNFFCNSGNLMPADFKDQMQNVLDSLPEDNFQAANLCACPTPEQLEEFCGLRSEILAGRGTAEQIKQLCELPTDDLKDIADLLQGGMPEMPPIVSDPGCDNGILPYETDEAIATATAALNNMLEQLKVDYARDMLGNGPGQKRWGLMNMILSDTMGQPLTAHSRKSFNRRAYVDFYMAQQPPSDADSDTSTIKNITDTIFPDPPMLKRQKGAFPTKVADWLQDYLNNSLTFTYSSNNAFQSSFSITKSLEEAGVETFGSGINLLRLDDSILGYNTSIEVSGDNLILTEKARKLTPDISLSFRDNCKGLQSSTESDGDGTSTTGDAHSSAFTLELYTSDLVSDDGSILGAHNRGSAAAQPWALTTFDDGHRHTYIINDDGDGETSIADGHVHDIKNNSVEEYCDSSGECHTHTLSDINAVAKGNLFYPRDATRVRVIDNLNTSASVDTAKASMVPVNNFTGTGKVTQAILTPKNSTDTEILNEFVKYEFLSVDNTLDGINFDNYPGFISTFKSYQDYAPQVILLSEILAEQGSSLSKEEIKDGYDAIMSTFFVSMNGDVANNSEAFDYGAVFDDLSYEDVEYVISEQVGSDPAGTNYYDVTVGVTDSDPEWMQTLYGSNRPLMNRDQILGISRMEYNISSSGYTDQENRVFYLDPLTYGGSYVNPPIHIKPLQNKGWLGFVDVMFPELSPCKPYTTDLIDFEDIQQKITAAYPNIPEDQRLKEDPDCVEELPYNRILDRTAAAGLEGLIAAAIRIYVSTNLIKALPVFTQFKPAFPDTFSNIYAQYIIEDMKKSFKDPTAIFQGPFKDTHFWYAFLEQGVQLYARRVDSEDIEDPPQDVLDALGRLNDAQETYEYPNRAELKEERGEMAGRFETLKSYRKDKNYEAIQASEEDAKLVFKELVIEQLNFMGERFVENLKIVGRAPAVSDLDYYLLQNLAQGGGDLTLNQEITQSYTDLPTEGDEHYTGGTEFASPDGSAYIGYYHVNINEEGYPVYMAGEFHSESTHDTLTPYSNKIEVSIGDIEAYGASVNKNSVTTPFVIEKYISVNGSRKAPEDAVATISAYDADLNISDVYPGDLRMVTDTNGQVVGLTGELGVRYGLKFSICIGGAQYEITTVEVDSLDLKVSQVDPLDGNSKLLFCLINLLKKDEKFRMISQYIFPLSKLTATMAMYVGEAFLPSIGEKVVPVGDVNSSDMLDKPGMQATFDDEGNVTYGDQVYGASGEVIDTSMSDGWAHKVDRDPGFLGGLFVLEWDNWDQTLLRNSKMRIKKMFKNYYNSRDFQMGDSDSSFGGPGDRPGVIITNEFKEKFKSPPGQGLLPWWKNRMRRTNPFNASGQLCENED